MKGMFLVLVFLNIVLAFIANPAPVSIEPTDLLLISLTGLIALFSLVSSSNIKIAPLEGRLLSAVILYTGYLLLSALIGFLHGVPVLNVLRSVGPYISFIPLIFIGFLPEKWFSPWRLGEMLIIVGILQTVYLGWLYFSHNPATETTLAVLRNRITFIDQRTTLPLLLAVPILPLMFLQRKKNAASPDSVTQAGWYLLIASGFFAGMVTLTRAIFLSIVVGWLIYLVASLYLSIQLKSFSWERVIKKMLVYLPIILVMIAGISLIPRIHLLEAGLFLRFHDHAANGGTDYSNGRIYDEWIPALVTWVSAGPLSWLFGIGAGSTFTVLSGEERTYIHNLSIYSLVYGGLFGLGSCLWLYFTLCRTLLFRALQTQSRLYVAFLALILSMFFYGQLFAVHKGLAFNEMLFLIIALALIRPDEASQLA